MPLDNQRVISKKYLPSLIAFLCDFLLSKHEAWNVKLFGKAYVRNPRLLQSSRNWLMSDSAGSWLAMSGSNAESAPCTEMKSMLLTLQSRMILSFERTTMVVRFFSVVNGNHSKISNGCSTPSASMLIECAEREEK